MKSNNHTILDLNKVAYANSYYRNQHATALRRIKPKQPTANGTEFNPNDYALNHPDYPQETLIERARRLDIVDKWLFVVKFQLSNGHTLEFTGERGQALYDAWKAKVFNKKRK